MLKLVGYVLPQIGLSKTFISYHVIAMMISVSLFEIIGNISNMIADFEGDRDIDFRLTLPISSRLVFISKIISLCIKCDFLKPRPLFHLFLCFETHITIFITNKCVNTSIQYTVPGFELTTFKT